MENTEKETPETKGKKLYRSRTDKIIFGVCGGLGEYFGIDSILFRIAFVLLVLGGGFGILLYIILALLIPSEPALGSAEFGERIKQNANDLARDLRDGRTSRTARNTIGAIIVIFGFFLLAGNLFPQFVRWDLFWPLALILLGLLLISRRKSE